MMPDPLVYQLLLVGLMLLYPMSHIMWPYDRKTSGSPTPLSAKAPRQRFRTLKPFPGLLHRPHCAACEQAAQVQEALPPPATLPIICRRGRPRAVGTSQHVCPYLTCAYRGWVGLDNLSANGHPRGGP
jgi:hypothetical protein